MNRLLLCAVVLGASLDVMAIPLVSCTMVCKGATGGHTGRWVEKAPVVCGPMEACWSGNVPPCDASIFGQEAAGTCDEFIPAPPEDQEEEGPVVPPPSY